MRRIQFMFLLVVSGLLLAACGAPAQAAACAAGEGETVVRPDGAGFCLTAPEGFSYHKYEDGPHLVYFGQESEIAEPPQPFVMVRSYAAEGRSLDEVGAAYLAAYTGIELAWQDAELDGKPALRIDQLIGQDLGRVMLVVYEDQVFELLFVPDDPTAGEAHQQMETLFARVVESFRFVD